MKISITNVAPDLSIELPNVEMKRMIMELETLKDKNLISSEEFPILWQISVSLKEKGIFEMQKLVTNL